MTNNELEILLSLRDEVSKKLDVIEKRTGTATKSMSMNWLKATAAIAGVTYAVKKLSEATFDISKELIRVNSQMEDFKTRIGVVAGSLEETNKIFADMKDIASKVPQTFEQVMGAATNLTAVVKGGSEEVRKLMPIILDISAATGIGVEETTGQMIRMYSAGAASADMFRERGVLAALGFQAGVSYSNEETINTIIQQWEDGTSKYKGATDRMAQTWTGVTSMMEDAWREFKEVIGAELFEAVKLDMRVIVEIMNEMKTEGGEYQEVVDGLGEGFERMYEGAKNFGIVAISSGAQVMDVFNEIKWVIKGVEASWLLFIQGIFQATDALGSIPFADKLIDKETTAAALEEVKNDVAMVVEEIKNARIQADIDYSMAARQQLDELLMKFNEVKEQMIAKDIQAMEAAVTAAQTEDKVKTGLVNAFVTLQKKIAGDMFKFDKETLKAGITLHEDYYEALNELVIRGGEIYQEVNKDKMGSLADTLNKAAQLNSNFAKAAAAVAIGEAVVNTAAGVTRALKDYAFPYSLIVGSLVAAAGAVEIATIASQQFSEGTDTVPAMLTPGEMVVPRTFADSIRQGDLALSGGGYGGSGNRIGDIFINLEINNPNVRSNDDIYTLSEEVSEQIAKEIERI